MSDQVIYVTPLVQGINVTQAAPSGVPTGGDGITQSAADARYVKLSQINAASGVAGLDENAQVASTRQAPPTVDLVILLRNKLA